MRIKETKQETYEFKRDVILGQWRRRAEAVEPANAAAVCKAKSE